MFTSELNLDSLLEQDFWLSTKIFVPLYYENGGQPSGRLKTT